MKGIVMSIAAKSYIITDCFCILYALSTLMHLNASMGSEHEVKKLRNMVCCYILFVVTSIACILCNEQSFSIPHIYAMLSYVLSIMSLNLGCYLWFTFVETRLHPMFSCSKEVSFLIFLPALTVEFLDVVSIFTGWMFEFDAKIGYKEGDLFIIQGISNFGYLLIPCLEFLVATFKTKSKDARNEYITYTLYMIIPLLAGFFEDSFNYIPILELSIYLMIHIFFVSIQNIQVNNDALTGLNNRQRLGTFFNEDIFKFNKSENAFLSMIDIDSFKFVNDLYGHVEGDKAIKLVARAIKGVADTTGAFAARYGGDEFCVVSKKEPLKLREEIEKAIEKETQNFPCRINISMGFAECHGTSANLAAVVSEADKMLYEEKNRKHVKRQ